MSKHINKPFLFLGIFILLLLTRTGKITFIDIFFNIIMSIVTTVLIDLIVVELPIRKKVRKMLIQLETINCFYVLAFWFMLSIHDEIYQKQKKRLNDVTVDDAKCESLKEAFTFLKKFSVYLQSETSSYSNIDNIIKINIASADVDEIWEYSCDVQRFYESFLLVSTSDNFELEFIKQLAYADHNCAEHLAKVLKDIDALYKCVGKQAKDVFSSLVLDGRRYFAGFESIEIRGYMKQWEEARKCNYLK